MLGITHTPKTKYLTALQSCLDRIRDNEALTAFQAKFELTPMMESTYNGDDYYGGIAEMQQHLTVIPATLLH